MFKFYEYEKEYRKIDSDITRLIDNVLENEEIMIRVTPKFYVMLKDGELVTYTNSKKELNKVVAKCLHDFVIEVYDNFDNFSKDENGKHLIEVYNRALILLNN